MLAVEISISIANRTGSVSARMVVFQFPSGSRRYTCHIQMSGQLSSLKFNMSKLPSVIAPRIPSWNDAGVEFKRGMSRQGVILARPTPKLQSGHPHTASCQST